MITTERDKQICKRHKEKDRDGRVHCMHCPLVKGNPFAYDFHCKANSHYNRKTKEWEYDE